MAERSILFATTGTGDGTASGYTAADLFELFRSLFTGATGGDYSGVAPDYLDMLAVAGSSSPLSVATGAALVYGIPYFNSAAVEVAIPTPTGATRIDRIVLRASWAAQTVRVTRVAGAEGGGAPALTTSAGTTWDMGLATVQITTGGVITITDNREYLLSLGDLGVSTAKLADLAVTTAKVADGAITSAKIADATIATADIENLAITAAKIADATITGGKLAPGTIAWTQLGDNIIFANNISDGQVTNAKLIDMAQATIKGRASGAGTGDPVDLTAAQVVAIVATADGTSSGLDADLLDGNHAAAFSVAAHTHATATLDNDSVTNSKLANMAESTVKGRQVGVGTGDPVDLTVGNLITIIGTGDGAGSGLDADILDGYHAAAFAAAVHTHTADRTAWAALTLTGSFTGAITPQYRLNGDVVEMRGSVTATGTGTLTVGTLPAGHRPLANAYFRPGNLPSTSYTNEASFLVSATGTINIAVTTGMSYSLDMIRFSITA